MDPSVDTAPWDRLARLLGTPDGSEAVNLLRQFGLLRGQESQPPRTDAERVLPRAIGPWTPRQDEFVRTSPWDKYLWLEERDVLRSHRPTGTFRLCVVGESVAAGMFFAPAITPAKVLHGILARHKPHGAASVEVIDLSRNAMRAKTLIDLADAAGQLRPDVLVVFAGNNFCRDHTVGRPDARNAPADYVRAANDAGLHGLVRAFSQNLGDSARATVRVIAENARRDHVRLIWVVPANCAAWQRPAPVPFLGGGRSAEWHQMFEAARSAISRGEFARALGLSTALSDLDGGIGQVSHRLAGCALLGLDRPAEAAEHFQREIDLDAALQRHGFLAPGCQSPVRDAILGESADLCFDCIDLPRVFADHTGSPVFDWRLFVDYCHLSVEGMHVAMTAVAARLAEQPPDTCDPTAGPQASIGRGLFEAAIYTSHLQHALFADRGVGELRHRFGAALTASPAVACVMADYVRFRGGAVVTELSPAAHRIVAGANSLLDFGILQWIHGIDAPTVEAICGALDDAGHDGAGLLASYQEYDKRRLATGFDLAHPRYLKSFARDGKVDWDPERGTRRTQPFLRSFWPDLPLVFAAEADTEVRCRLTARLPGGPRTAPVRVFVNGTLAATVAITERWSQGEFVIDRSFVRAGFNDLVLNWPHLERLNDDVRTPVRRFQTIGSADWAPVFGEVFSLYVRSCPSTTARVA